MNSSASLIISLKCILEMKLLSENFTVLSAVDQNTYLNVPLTVIHSFLKSEDFIKKRNSFFLLDIYWPFILHFL